MTKATDDEIAGRRVVRLANVSIPTLTFYRPAPAKNTGAAVLVCPGGGYRILAWDLEGTEICEWLSSVGVTGVLLKYRVPCRDFSALDAAPLQDAQRAMGLIRQEAAVLGIDPDRIGVLGFSAGGHLAARLGSGAALRCYPVVDAADQQPYRPNFCMLVYPAYLTSKGQGDRLSPELPVDEKTPPTFIAMTQDDPLRVETALFYYLALRNKKIPAEMHLYPNGGHGYGLRRTRLTVTTWPDRAFDWMKATGWLESALTSAP